MCGALLTRSLFCCCSVHAVPPHTQTSTSDDKKLGSTLKKLGVTNIPAIEEVNMFTTDGASTLSGGGPGLQLPHSSLCLLEMCERSTDSGLTLRSRDSLL